MIFYRLTEKFELHSCLHMCIIDFLFVRIVPHIPLGTHIQTLIHNHIHSHSPVTMYVHTYRGSRVRSTEDVRVSAEQVLP